jgi:hypothetical protein
MSGGYIQRRNVFDKIGEGSNPGHLLFNDFYNRPERISKTLSNLVAKGALVAGDKGKLKINIRPLAETSPWYHIRRSTNRQCGLWHDIYFEQFGFVHSGCLKCWKTVIVPEMPISAQRVTDLFRLKGLLNELGMPSKCGTDVRMYTPHKYVGFIYGDSLEEGREYHNIISKQLSNHFPKGHAILKLGCTEFEHRFGPTDKWNELIPQWKFLENYLDYLIEPQSEQYNISLLEHTDADTFRFWIEYAYGTGDPSWKQALEAQGYDVASDDLFFKPKTYHEIEEKENDK